MRNQTKKTMKSLMEGACYNWDLAETVELKDAEGNPVTVSVRGGMPLQEIFELSMELAWGIVSDGGQVSAVFAEMIMAQGILDRLTNLPLPENVEQEGIDQCYELVYGYNGILNQLDLEGPAYHLVQRIHRYTMSQADAFLRDPEFVQRIEDDDDMEPEIIGLEDLRKMQKNNS